MARSKQRAVKTCYEPMLAVWSGRVEKVYEDNTESLKAERKANSSESEAEMEVLTPDSYKPKKSIQVEDSTVRVESKDGPKFPWHETDADKNRRLMNENDWDSMFVFAAYEACVFLNKRGEAQAKTIKNACGMDQYDFSGAFIKIALDRLKEEGLVQEKSVNGELFYERVYPIATEEEIASKLGRNIHDEDSTVRVESKDGPKLSLHDTYADNNRRLMNENDWDSMFVLAAYEACAFLNRREEAQAKNIKNACGMDKYDLNGAFIKIALDRLKEEGLVQEKSVDGELFYERVYLIATEEEIASKLGRNIEGCMWPKSRD